MNGGRANGGGRATPGRAIPAPTGIRGAAAPGMVFYHMHDSARFDVSAWVCPVAARPGATQGAG